MRIVIAYDQDGNIVNVARVRSLPEDIPHPFADLTEAHRILSIEEPEGELREADLSEIPRRFRVDIATEQLIAVQEPQRTVTQPRARPPQARRKGHR
jgi:hypothetical protein